MKKVLITIAIVAICTLVFLFSFRYISGASSAMHENAEYITVEETSVSDEVSHNEISEKNEIGNNENGELSLPDKSDAEIDSGEGELRAEKDSHTEEIKDYIKERIIPVVVGVLTSLSAVLASLGAIKKSLARLSGARDDFKNEASERKSEFARQSALLESKASELSELARLLPQLENDLVELKKAQEKLNEEAYNIGKMISLGFSGSYSVVKSGNGRKIAALLSECRALSGKKDTEAFVGEMEGADSIILQDDILEKGEKENSQIAKKARKQGREGVKNEEI